MSSEIAFCLNGRDVVVAVEDGESLLNVLRERLGVHSVKDGCAPQGQCGCCTVLVDGAPRVACVTPAPRVAGREVTTIEGIAAGRIDPLVDQFVAHGASQCGFCTPGIMLRCLGLSERATPPTRLELDRALAAHLCRCTGWVTIMEAVTATSAKSQTPPLTANGNDTKPRDLELANLQAELEGRTPQRTGAAVVRGNGGFADDCAPIDALVAVPLPFGSTADARSAGGIDWVIAESLFAARSNAGKVQGRKTTLATTPPLSISDLACEGVDDVALATSWLEPAYLEPDASWCDPGGRPSSVLANGGAFGGKTESIASRAAHELANALGRSVRTVFSREDVVRFGPKRPPIAAVARYRDAKLWVNGRGARDLAIAPNAYGIATEISWERVEIDGPKVTTSMRAPWAESAILLEAALDQCAVERSTLVDEIGRAVLLDVCVRSPEDSYAGARAKIDDGGVLRRVELKVACGLRHDEVVARSYAIGAVHMALGWVLTEGLTVDHETGEVHDLTIRSFGVVRPKLLPDIDVVFVADDRGPMNGSDAVFVAAAAAIWNAVTRSERIRPKQFPALETNASRVLRR